MKFAVSSSVAERAVDLVRNGARRLPVVVKERLESVVPLAPRRRMNFTNLSVLLLIVLPTILYFLYAWIWQSKYYVSETRMTVRASTLKSDKKSSIGAIIQNSYIVLSYIKSSAVLNDLGGRDYLIKRFGFSDIDYFSRLGNNPRVEDMLKYWLDHIHVSVDITSGIITTRIIAYRPQDAVELAKDLVRHSEKLINDITYRQRLDAIERIGKEVAFEADKLAKARAAVTLFRQNNKLMDPSKSAQSIGELIGKLMASKIEIESSLSTLKSVIGTESPMRNLQLTKLAAIDEQIRELKSKLTNSKGDDDVATQLGTYERLQLDEQFALAMYMAAQGAYQAARLSMNSQELYLAVVVNPALPQEAEGPRVFSSTLLLLVSLSILWAIAALLVSSVNDHVA